MRLAIDAAFIAYIIGIYNAKDLHVRHIRCDNRWTLYLLVAQS